MVKDVLACPYEGPYKKRCPPGSRQNQGPVNRLDIWLRSTCMAQSPVLVQCSHSFCQTRGSRRSKVQTPTCEIVLRRIRSNRTPIWNVLVS